MSIFRITQRYHNAKEFLRYQGVKAYGWHNLSKILAPFGVFGIATLYEQDLTFPPPEVRVQADVVIHLATESDIQQVEAMFANPLDWLPLRERLLQGARCFVAKAGGEVVHYNWVFLDWSNVLPISSGGRYIVLDADEAFCAIAYTAVPWRGRAIHTAVLRAMLVWLRESGYRRAYTVVNIANPASSKTHARLGWRLLGSLVYFKKRGMDRSWVWHGPNIPSRFVARYKSAKEH